MKIFNNVNAFIKSKWMYLKDWWETWEASTSDESDWEEGEASPDLGPSRPLVAGTSLLRESDKMFESMLYLQRNVVFTERERYLHNKCR